MNAPLNGHDMDLGLWPRRRTRLVRQAEVTECGLACLAMVANVHGHDLDIGALRRRFGVSSRGMGLRALMQSADTLGFTGRPLKVTMEALGQVKTPAVLHWDMNHFVVLDRMRGGRAFILDPAGEARWIDAETLSRRFTGVALELRPSTNFEPVRESARLRLGQLWSGSSGLKRALAQVALLSLVLQAYVLASPYLLQLAVDGALPAFDADLMTVLALGFGLFALVNAGATLLRSFVLLASGVALSFGVSSNIARRLFRLPIAWFEVRTVGDVLSRFQSVQPIQKLLTESAAASVVDGLLAVLTVVLMAVYSVPLALVATGAAGLYALVRALTVGAERRAEAERIVAAGKEQGAMIESLRGVVTLRLAGRETLRHAVWQNRLSESLGAGYAHERIKAWQTAAYSLITGVELVLLVWLAVRHAIAGGFSVGMIFAFMAYRQQFTVTAKTLVDRGVELRMLSLHLERLSDIALTPEDRGFAEPSALPDDFKGGIELRGVTYRYGLHEPFVLKGVDLVVRPGEHVAVTGTSGGGKSTLAKILLGLVEPTAGEVLVDGEPLARVGRRAFREEVGAVLQDDLLFAGTIAENVAGFDPVDLERVREALAAAAVLDEVERMPMKHLTVVGDMGSSLSGGQRQRVLLARALHRRPRVLVMDEGTAHLDAEHEREVNRAVSAMGITRIVIAHRRETIEAADRVIHLVDGRVAEAPAVSLAAE